MPATKAVDPSEEGCPDEPESGTGVGVACGTVPKPAPFGENDVVRQTGTVRVARFTIGSAGVGTGSGVAVCPARGAGVDPAGDGIAVGAGGCTVSAGRVIAVAGITLATGAVGVAASP
ncbi:MAG: hypothetical protein IIB27_04515 [Chloroflexi bacterium]|nr:hypothetical protein [Chloroflexota bacterium]